MMKVAPDVVDDLLAGLRPSERELAELRQLEHSGKREAFAQALSRLDKRQELWAAGGVEGLDPKLLNREAFRPALARAEPMAVLAEIAAGKPVAGVASASLLAALLAEKKVQSDGLVPLKFSSLRTYPGMSGPDTDNVRYGLLGACRRSGYEYTISNPGRTEGKTRLPLPGHIILSFSAILPETASYYVLKPAGTLWIKGHSRVVGHGNSTTSFDAKVWVHYVMDVLVAGQLREIAIAQMHYDGTRSEDRTKQFWHELEILPLYVLVPANAGDELLVRFRLQVDTEANEDGIAIAVVDYFGFPANLKSDYDSVVTKAS